MITKNLRKILKESDKSKLSRLSGVSRQQMYQFINGSDILLDTAERLICGLEEMDGSVVKSDENHFHALD